MTTTIILFIFISFTYVKVVTPECKSPQMFPQKYYQVLCISAHAEYNIVIIY